MNKTKIDWGFGKDFYTWNPITGCTNGCKFCYARKIAMRFDGHFKPTFHPERLAQPYNLKKPSTIFVCSMGDMFDGEAKVIWGEMVWGVIVENIQHKFLILTKQPNHIKWYNIEPLDNLMIGVSITNKNDLWRVGNLKEKWAGKKFISFEPLLGDVGKLNLNEINWVIIGGQTNPDFKPPKEWVDNIKRQAKKKGIPVFLKSNLGGVK
jgi:protein gp37